MTQRRRPGRSDRNATRAWTVPMRAVTRILTAEQSSAEVPRSRDTRDTGDPSAIVDCGLYVDGVRQAGTWGYAEALAEARRRGDAFVWLGLHTPTQPEMAGIAAAYGLHELAVEDAVHAGQRPKLEQFGDVAFLALRTARYLSHEELTDTSEIVETGYLMLFVGEHFVITVRHGDAVGLAPVRTDLERKPDLLRHGPWAVAYAVTDRVVDLYLDVAFAIEQDLDDLEGDVFSRQSSPDRIQSIYQLKRELVEFKRAVFPLQRPLQSLVAADSGVPAEVRRYIGDVQDHLTRAVEQVNSSDEVLNSILQARLAQVTVDQNNDMRKIAAWAAIAAVQTAIAGIYGMNFEYMPERELLGRYVYPAILAVMVASAFALYRLFRRSGWL